VSHVVPPSITHQLTNEAPPAYNQQEVGVSATSATAATVSQTQAASQGPAEFRTDLPSHIQNQGVLSDGVNTSPDTHAKLSGMTSTSHHVFQGAEHTYEQGEFTDEKRAQPAASVEDATPGGAETAEEAEDDDDDDFNPSLRLYIEARIEELSKEKQYTTAVQSFICAALEYRGDGTFLWVDFAVEELKKIQVDVIEDTVNSLPPALDEMYSRILINIDPSLVDLVVGLLRWTVCARRPMDLLELTVALNLSHFGNQNAMAFILNAVTACGNMIKIGEEDLTVNLVHQSVVDFLTGEDSQLLSDPRLARFHIRPSQIDGDIATFCISYLESGPFNEKAICQAQNAEEYNQHILQHPFVPYAASFWPDHLKEASNPTLNLSSPFFLPKSKARKNWWKTYWAFTTGKATWVAPTNFNVLHLAAYLNLVSVAQQVAQRGELQSRLNKRDSHGMTPLDYTVAMGHIPMFMFLVQQGAKQEPLGETILELAVRKGQRDMVALLLDMGWNVNLRAQQLTPMGSLYTMTRWLPGAFNEGLDLNRDTWSMMFKDVGVQETPLHQSATFGHLAVMELLLERGADISAGTTKGFTPLHSASYTGHLQCVELLVERGANVNWVTTEQWLPLHYAAMRGKTAVVEFFLDLGVPIDSLNIKAKTALHLAAYAGHAELVQILVERGANVELKSYKGETPLHLATRHTKPQIVELLLSLGADRSAVTNEGVTALQMAQASTLIDAKECLRILQTYGMEGYVPWQPPQQQNVAQQSGQGDTSAQDTQTAQNEQTTTAGVETANEDAGARRASMAPTARTFGHTAVPRAATFQGFEANISVQVHPPQQPSYGSPVPQHPMQSMEPGQGTGGFATMQPNFGGPYSDPAAGGSKFSYDANVNMPQYMGKDNGVAYGAMSPPSAPPPPYTAAVGVSPSPALPEKSPAWTAQMNQSSMQPNLPMQATPLAPSSPPTQSASTFQMMPSTHPWPSGSSQTPVPQAQAASAPITPAPQSSSSSMVQMLSSMAISTPASPSPATQTPQISTPGPAMQPPPTPIVQAQQPYQSQANPQYHAPATPNIQAASPAPLMSPFQPAATPLSPYQPPATPVQQYPQQQQQSQFQTPVSPIQPVQQQPPPSPMHYTAGLNLTSAHSPYNSPPIQQPSQFLSPITTPYGRQQQGPAPVQSPHFSGNSTASTFNSSYTYSAPAVSAPYNPNLGQMPMQPGGPWQGQPNNGMMFAPPPPQGQKKKSFLGGLVPGR
jgi:ankyrin repeat protein